MANLRSDVRVYGVGRWPTWSSPGSPSQPEPPRISFVDPRVVVDPEKPALLFGNDQRSYRELEQRSDALAHVLIDLGAGPDTPVAVMLPNGFEIIEAGIATAKAGCYFLPLNWHLGPEEVGWILADSQAPVLISHIDLAPTVEAAMVQAPRCAALVVGDGPRGTYEHRLAEAPKSPPDRPGRRVTPGYRFYTSGTTGRPRGVEADPGHEDRSGGTSRAVIDLWGIRSSDVFLVSGPIYHAAGSYAFISVHAGATVAILPRFEARAWLAAVEQHQASATLMVPAHFIRVLEVPEAEWHLFDLSSLRLIIHGAAPCPVPVKRRFIDALPGAEVWELYAGSEGAGTRISPQEWLERPGSVGRAWPGVEVTIRDDQGRSLPPGSTGLVYMTSRRRFHYHNDPEKTAAAWQGDAFTLGDIGFVDPDGYLHLTDRKADVVIRGGVNIYPAEIERALSTHPAVVDCAVFGAPDERLGEIVRALVEVRGPVKAGELADHCRSQLALFKCPQDIVFIDELPRDPSGKVRKRHLRDQAWEGRTNKIRTG